jgi:hypothetical protein
MPAPCVLNQNPNIFILIGTPTSVVDSAIFMQHLSHTIPLAVFPLTDVDSGVAKYPLAISYEVEKLVSALSGSPK